MRLRSMALIALTTFVFAASSAFACDKDAKSASAGTQCSGAKAASAGAHCTGAQAASAGAQCTAGEKSASAGSGCCGGNAASAGAAGTCTGDKTASASGCPFHADAKTAGATCHGDAAMVVYHVSGMHCGACANKVETAVTDLKMDNVTGCMIDLEKGLAVVTLADGKQLDDASCDVVAKAITAAGFPAEREKAEAAAPETAKPETATETSTM